MFEILRQSHIDVWADNLGATEHTKQRMSRFRCAEGLVGEFTLRSSYVVDTGHANGLEIHSIYTNGAVVIANKESLKVVTILIARPAQLKRYGITDTDLLDIAYINNINGYNQL